MTPHDALPAGFSGHGEPMKQARLLAEHLAGRSQGLSLSDILREMGWEEARRSTVHTWLSLARAQGWVEVTGERRWARWSAAAPLQREALRRYLDQPVSQRPRIGYDPGFLEEYQPNRSYYLDAASRQRLHAQCQPGSAVFSGLSTHDQSLFMCGLSFASSNMEGNPYDMAATEKLLLEQQEKVGASPTDTTMILNHHEAVSYLVNNIQYPPLRRNVALLERDIKALHALLSAYLLKDPRACGRLRRCPVRIDQSSYVPLVVPDEIARCFSEVLHKANQIEDPYEQAFFLLVHLPYLQAFEDCNKRTARVACNIPLLRAGVIPMSWMDVDHREFTSGLLGVYEKCDPVLLAEVFTQGYIHSSERFLIMQRSAAPDEIVVNYRQELRSYIRAVVLGGDVDTPPDVRPEHQQAFFEFVERELAYLRDLDQAALVRLRLKEGDVRQWLAQDTEAQMAPVRERQVA